MSTRPKGRKVPALKTAKAEDQYWRSQDLVSDFAAGSQLVHQASAKREPSTLVRLRLRRPLLAALETDAKAHGGTVADEIRRYAQRRAAALKRAAGSKRSSS